MSAQTNRTSALRRCIGVTAGVMALAFSAPAWAEPVGLICVTTGYYNFDGVFELHDGSAQPFTYVLDVEAAKLGGMPAVVTDDRIQAVWMADEHISIFTLNRYDLTLNSMPFLIPENERSRFQSMWAEMDTVAERQAVLTEALRMQRVGLRYVSQCRVQQRGV